jgi:multicomponent Na+:H+ antiporter subunit D
MGMIGLPPTGGFFGKWYIILGALEANNYVAVGAVLLSTMLTLAYFVRIFERVFRHAPTLSDARPNEIPIQIKLSVGFTSMAIIVLGLLSDPIVGLLIDYTLPPGL